MSGRERIGIGGRFMQEYAIKVEDENIDSKLSRTIIFLDESVSLNILKALSRGSSSSIS